MLVLNPDVSQIKLLQLLSDGNTQKQIASEMGISHRTVEWKLQKLRQKFECVSNEQLTKKAVKMELIN